MFDSVIDFAFVVNRIKDLQRKFKRPYTRIQNNTLKYK